MKKILFLAVIFVMIMSSCAAPVNGIPVEEVTSIPTEMPVSNDTPTLTPEPTLTPTATPMPYPTPTLMLTPTPVEWELVPYIEKVIEYEWRGVLIKARLIIDDSLSSKIESIEISDELLAEVVARALFFVWVQRKGGTSWMSITPSDINEYMEMWATAQDSGLESDWRKVQINDIWANDLTDGNGYVQSQHNVWPMFYGDAPYGVTPLNTLTIAFVSNEGFDNVTFILGNHMSAGTNLNDGDFLIYRGFDEEWLKSIPNGSTLERMYLSNLDSTGTWLAWNDNGVFNSDMLGDRTYASKLKTGVDIKLR